MPRKKPFTVEITGMKKTAAFLNVKEKNIDRAMTKGLQQASFFMEGEVKQSIAGRREENKSVDTGRFLQSVTSNVLRDQAVVYSDVRYAPFLEFGTSRLVARRHFFNSLERNRAKVVRFFNNLMKKI